MPHYHTEQSALPRTLHKASRRLKSSVLQSYRRFTKGAFNGSGQMQDSAHPSGSVNNRNTEFRRHSTYITPYYRTSLGWQARTSLADSHLRAWIKSQEAYSPNPSNRVRVASLDITYPSYSKPIRPPSATSFRLSDFPPDITYAPLMENKLLLSPLKGWDISWRTFKSLHLKAPLSADDCLYVLGECSRLEDFTCSLNGSPHEFLGNPLHVRNLCSLTIRASTNPKHLLNRLELPGLKSFHLSCIGTYRCHTEIGLPSLIRRSKCSLEDMFLVNVYPTVDELIACLELVDQLMELAVWADDDPLPSADYLRGRTISDSVLQQLTKGRNSKCLCRDLQKLELSPCSSTDGVLAGMVASRRADRSGMKLDSITYRFLKHEEHPKDVKSLNELESRTIRLHRERQLRVKHVI